VFEIDVDEVGPSLRSATAKVTRTTRSASSGGFGQGQSGGPGDDPWSTPAPAGGQQPASGGGAGWAQQSDEPPF